MKTARGSTRLLPVFLHIDWLQGVTGGRLVPGGDSRQVTTEVLETIILSCSILQTTRVAEDGLVCCYRASVGKSGYLVET